MLSVVFLYWITLGLVLSSLLWRILHASSMSIVMKANLKESKLKSAAQQSRKVKMPAAYDLLTLQNFERAIIRPSNPTQRPDGAN